MNKKKKYLTLIVITIICGTLLNWFFCCKKPDKVVAPIVEKVTPVVSVKKNIYKGISIVDSEGSFNFNDQDHFNFSPSSAAYLTPISPSMDSGMENLQLYLEKHPEKNILITGYYKNDEEYNGALPNLGLARATEVKNYLINKNISSKQLDVDSKLEENLILDDENIYRGPISLNFQSVNANRGKELEALKLRIQAEPLILYFQTGGSNIQLSDAQKQKILDISRYLDKTSDKSAIVTGHTDSVGNVAKNTELGQKRAEFAKEYLIKNGISASKIITDSKGPLEPIADNNTAEGRSKNRRTVININ